MKKSIISAPLNVITGTLGAGKTLFAIEQADLLRQEGRASAVYQVGINEPDVRHLPPLPFPLSEWAERADAGDLKGAVIIVDEFHKWMPQRGPGRPPKWIEELAEARRRGVIFLLLTQSGEFDHFLKGTRLNKHFFLSRKGYLSRSTIYEWGERFVANPHENKEARKEAIITNWWHPKKYYGWYKSAEAHRFRVRLPLRVWLAFAFVPVAIYFAKQGLTTVTDLASGDSVLSGGVSSALASPVVSSAAPVGVGQGGESKGIRPTLDGSQYLQQFEPLFPHLPWSAPAYQGREVVAKPDIYCMAVGQDGADGCSCYSEQGTKLSKVPELVCQSIARDGLYNPYRAPLASEGAGGSPASASSLVASPAAPEVASLGLPGSVVSKGERANGSFPEVEGYHSQEW